MAINTTSDINGAFLSLVRLGIGHAATFPSEKTEWTAIQALAERQGLAAVLIDGIEKIPSPLRPPQEILLQWIGEVLQNYDQRYVQYEKAIGSLAGFYNQHGFKMMVLKGYACAQDWPRPNHRPCGDIDIYLFGEQEKADELLNAELSIKIDKSHHHHTVFEWEGFAVENHYDFINVYHHRSHVALEKILKDLGQDDTHFVEVNGEKIYLPSPNLHALFLIKHAALHFVGTELTFRHVLDWAFFVQKHGKEVDWDWLHRVLEEHGLMPFYQILNAICVGDLGFDVKLFPKVQFDPFVKERVVNEIFSSVYQGGETKNLFIRQIDRFRRWKGNEWKHKLCYKESMMSAFWSGVWRHLLKPRSI